MRGKASVDLGEEDRDAAGGEVRDVVDGRLPLFRPEAYLQRVYVLERNALAGDRAAVRRREAPSGFEPLQARDLLRERGVGVRVVALEDVGILRRPVARLP